MIRVLVIEDNEDDIELTRRAFQRAGLGDQMRVAGDGVEALDYLFGRGSFAGEGATASVSLVLLDLHLPKIPGLEVLRQIRMNESTRDLPVVVLTVSKEEPDLLQSFTMGVSDYLIKPVDIKRLVQVLGKYIKEPAE